MNNGFWLSDEQFSMIRPYLPCRAAGKRREDDRRIISGIIHVLQSGCRWQDHPAEYGPPTTVYNRYNRWSQKGIPQQISIDASHVKVHRCAGAGGGKRGYSPLHIEGT